MVFGFLRNYIFSYDRLNSLLPFTLLIVVFLILPQLSLADCPTGQDTGVIEGKVNPSDSGITVIIYNDEDYNSGNVNCRLKIQTSSDGTYRAIVPTAKNYQVVSDGIYTKGKNYQLKAKNFLDVEPGETTTVNFSLKPGAGNLKIKNRWKDHPVPNAGMRLEVANDSGIGIPDSTDANMFDKKTDSDGVVVYRHLPPGEVDFVSMDWVNYDEISGTFEAPTINVNGDSYYVDGSTLPEVEVKAGETNTITYEPFRMAKVSGFIRDASGNIIQQCYGSFGSNTTPCLINLEEDVVQDSGIIDRAVDAEATFEYLGDNGRFVGLVPSVARSISLESSFMMPYKLNGTNEELTFRLNFFDQLELTPYKINAPDTTRLGTSYYELTNGVYRGESQDFNQFLLDQNGNSTPDQHEADVFSLEGGVFAIPEDADPGEMVRKGLSFRGDGVDTDGDILGVHLNGDYYASQGIINRKKNKLDISFIGDTFVAISGGTQTITVEPEVSSPSDLGSIRGTLSTSDGELTFRDRAVVFAVPQFADRPFQSVGIPRRSDGEYRLSHLVPGDYTLLAYARDDQGNWYSPYTKRNISVSSGDTSDQDIEIGKGITLSGTVREDNEDGQSIANAKVEIPSQDRTTYTASDGSFEITGLNPTNTSIEVSRNGYTTLKDSIDIGQINNSSDTLLVTLEPGGGKLTGFVTSDGDTPLDGLSVIVSNREAGVWQKTETDGGTYTIGGLEPSDSYTITAGGLSSNGNYYSPRTQGLKSITNDSITAVNFSTTNGNGLKQWFDMNFRSTRDSSNPDQFHFTITSNRRLDGPPTCSTNGQNNNPKPTFTNAGNGRSFKGTYTRTSGDTTIDLICEGTLKANPSVTAPDTFTGIDISSDAPDHSSSKVINVNQNSTKKGGGSAIDIPNEASVEIPAQSLEVTDENTGRYQETAEVNVNTEISSSVDNAPASGNSISNSVGVTVEATQSDYNTDVDTSVGIKISLAYDTSTDFSPSEVDVRYYDTATESWKTNGISNVTVQPLQRRIVFRTDHLTEFAAFTGIADGGFDSVSNEGGGCLIERSFMPESGLEPLREMRDSLLSTPIGRMGAEYYYHYFGSD